MQDPQLRLPTLQQPTVVQREGPQSPYSRTNHIPPLLARSRHVHAKFTAKKSRHARRLAAHLPTERMFCRPIGGVDKTFTTSQSATPLTYLSLGRSATRARSGVLDHEILQAHSSSQLLFVRVPRSSRGRAYIYTAAALTYKPWVRCFLSNCNCNWLRPCALSHVPPRPLRMLSTTGVVTNGRGGRGGGGGFQSRLRTVRGKKVWPSLLENLPGWLSFLCRALVGLGVSGRKLVMELPQLRRGSSGRSHMLLSDNPSRAATRWFVHHLKSCFPRLRRLYSGPTQQEALGCCSRVLFIGYVKLWRVVTVTIRTSGKVRGRQPQVSTPSAHPAPTSKPWIRCNTPNSRAMKTSSSQEAAKQQR